MLALNNEFVSKSTWLLHPLQRDDTLTNLMKSDHNKLFWQIDLINMASQSNYESGWPLSNLWAGAIGPPTKTINTFGPLDKRGPWNISPFRCLISKIDFRNYQELGARGAQNPFSHCFAVTNFGNEKWCPSGDSPVGHFFILDQYSFEAYLMRNIWHIVESLWYTSSTYS